MGCLGGGVCFARFARVWCCFCFSFLGLSMCSAFVVCGLGGGLFFVCVCFVFAWLSVFPMCGGVCVACFVFLMCVVCLCRQTWFGVCVFLCE